MAYLLVNYTSQLFFKGPLMNPILFILLGYVLFSSNAWCLPSKPIPEGMVVTSQHLATVVGRDILAKGGNAIDAAVAVGYALSVVEPCCGNLGGGGFMLIHLKDNQDMVINFREKAPLKANASLYFDQEGKPLVEKLRAGYLAVGVPGTVMGLNTALEKYGTMSLKEVIEPSIKLAEQGFTLVPGDVRFMTKAWDQLKQQPNIAAIFAHEGRMLQAGDRLIQPQLAETLKQLVKGGTTAFYKGSIAQAIVASSKKHGGVLSLQDFLEYTIEIQTPIQCHYRGYDVITVPPPSSGGVVLCEMLNIVSGYPLTQLGYRTPLSTHYTLEAMRFAYRDRNQLGDPNRVSNPVKQLLSPTYAASIRRQIPEFHAANAISVPANQRQEHAQTTHYSIVDKEGNAVAVTYTLNDNFGAKVMAGDTGIFLNNEMDDFNLKSGVANEFALTQGDNNRIQPGKRPLSSMTPTMVFRKGALFMVLGAPGGSTIPTQVLETLQNVIDYHLPLQDAVDAPRYHMQWLPNVVYMELDAFSKQTLVILKKMGYHFTVGSPFHTPRWGAVAAIQTNGGTGKPMGAIDNRRPQGLVLGQ